MLHTVPSPPTIKTQTIRIELRRLYSRRSAIDRLMQALELYGKHAVVIASEPTRIGPKIADGGRRSLQVGVI